MVFFSHEASLDLRSHRAPPPPAPPLLQMPLLQMPGFQMPGVARAVEVAARGSGGGAAATGVAAAGAAARGHVLEDDVADEERGKVRLARDAAAGVGLGEAATAAADLVGALASGGAWVSNKFNGATREGGPPPLTD